jgi:sigma-B regulation protein RsbU (phosphoserine phosphatase)
LLYSDGLTEARTSNRRQRYDDDGALLRFATARAPSTAAQIMAALQALLEKLGPGVEDDIALLALGVPG